jgi:hypothetical protein
MKAGIKTMHADVELASAINRRWSRQFAIPCEPIITISFLLGEHCLLLVCSSEVMETMVNAMKSPSVRLHGCFMPFSAVRPTYRSGLWKLKAEKNNGNGISTREGISEDVLQRLRIAEEEAAILRQELAKARAEALAKVVLHPADGSSWIL